MLLKFSYEYSKESVIAIRKTRLDQRGKTRQRCCYFPRKDEASMGGRDEVNAPGSAKKNIHLIEESWQYKFIEHEKQHLVLNAWELKSLKRGEDAVPIFETLKD